MSDRSWPEPLSTRAIRESRGPRNPVDPRRPYAFLSEEEHSRFGVAEPVSTLFLTNRECPFHCLYCDLWKNTTEETIAAGLIPEQIGWALSQLPPARHIKLYNSGNFFDPRAIPPEDWPSIARRVQDFDTVIVENHPRLTDERCLAFRDQLSGELEVAMGLETIHPEVLPRLNKGMTLADFDQAVEFLGTHGIATRAFILLRPPYLGEEAGLEWALRSVEYAFSRGVRFCAVIPTRGGNGIMEQLRSQGQYAPPTLGTLERVLEAGLAMGRGRVTVDLWDAEQLTPGEPDAVRRIDRLARMNLTQRLEARFEAS